MNQIALRVLDEKSQAMGVSLYAYERNAPPVAAGELLSNPGTLKRRICEIPPGGNHVMSELSVYAPDDADSEEIISAFESFRKDYFADPPPWFGKSGRCIFEFNCVLGLYSTAPHEMKELFRRTIGFKSEVHRA